MVGLTAVEIGRVCSLSPLGSHGKAGPSGCRLSARESGILVRVNTCTRNIVTRKYGYSEISIPVSTHMNKVYPACATRLMALSVLPKDGLTERNTKLSLVLVPAFNKVMVAQMEAIGQPITDIWRARQIYPCAYFSRRKKENHGNKMASLFMRKILILVERRPFLFYYGDDCFGVTKFS